MDQSATAHLEHARLAGARAEVAAAAGAASGRRRSEAGTASDARAAERVADAMRATARHERAGGFDRARVRDR